MSKTRRRKLQRPKQSKQKRLNEIYVTPLAGQTTPPRLRFINLGLSDEEVRNARQISTPTCIGCSGAINLAFVLGWRNANGVAYLAAFCWACVADIKNHKEPSEVELKIDLALFEAASVAQEALAEGEVRQ